MFETGTVIQKKKSFKPKLKNGLLVIQILLPFVGYVVLQTGRNLLADIVAGLFTLSMVMLVWAG
jgi:hypothetical protein